MRPVFAFAGSGLDGVGYLLQPGLLPHGLRRLQLVADRSLQAGSIPSTVEVLQVRGRVTSPLSIHHLPSSLIHLVLGYVSRSLDANVLPASMQRLYMRKYEHPLAVGVLPPSLRALHIAYRNQPIEPHVLPCSLTQLSLDRFNYPLAVGCLPRALVALDIGAFQQLLPPCLLPSSLRVLWLSCPIDHLLLPGALPEGLVVLHLRSRGNRCLPPGVLPSTLRVLDMGCDWEGDIKAGAISDSVRWLRLPVRMEGVVERHLPAGGRVEWVSENALCASGRQHLTSVCDCECVSEGLGVRGGNDSSDG